MKSANPSVRRVALNVRTRDAQGRISDRGSVDENLYPVDPAGPTQRPTGDPAGGAADGIEWEIDSAHHVAAGGERVGATENARPASNGKETTEKYRPAFASNHADGARGQRRHWGQPS